MTIGEIMLQNQIATVSCKTGKVCDCLNKYPETFKKPTFLFQPSFIHQGLLAEFDTKEINRKEPKNMFQPLLQISLKAFIHRGVTRKQECKFTNSCFTFTDDPTVSVKTLRMHSFQESIVFSSMNSVITVLPPQRLKDTSQ